MINIKEIIFNLNTSTDKVNLQVQDLAQPLHVLKGYVIMSHLGAGLKDCETNPERYRYWFVLDNLMKQKG